MKSIEAGREVMAIEAGDVLQRPKGLVTHMGIALAGGRVFHNTPEKGEHVSTFAEFSQGQTVSVVKNSHKDRLKALQRVQVALKNPQKYEVLSNNCEHTVTKITKGVGTSSQLMFGLVAFGVVSYLLFKN